MMTLIFRLPSVAWHLSRGGVFGHLAHVHLLPSWLRSLMRGFDRLIARRNPDRPGVALAHALTSLGPGFIKFGQALSTRADLMGADVARDLALLQDQLDPFPSPVARRTLARELGQDIDDVFARFEDDPVAAASIAQVHFATLKDGRDVAVKILRPGIRAKLERDIRFFRSMARLLEAIAPATKRLKLTHAVDQFAHYSDVELDLRLEGASASKLKDNHAKDEGIHVPAIEWALTTEHVLVIERVVGTRIDDREALLAKGHTIDDLTTIAAKSFFFQVFRDGFFHADMHPGNIFIRDDGVLVPIDFGIMGDLSLNDRMFLARLLMAILDRDYQQVAQLHRDAGMIGQDVSLEGFAQAIRAVTEPVMDQPMGDVSVGTILGQIFGLARRYHVEVQPQFTLLQKTMVMAEGVGRQLNPDANMWPIARDLAAEWAEDKDSWLTQISTIADKALSFGLRLPELMDRAETLLDHMERQAEADHPRSNSARYGLTRHGLNRHGFTWSHLVVAVAVAAVVYFVN
ncbi:MAG: 2-polyprenylphenol 6-hydroxylase [Alphaproteobacteria bacterium]|nr:2-polyprenylphenol 6-hydroxylase [Alphaproteobacteria bacterium]